MEESNSFIPTTQWMAKKYQELNQTLFDGVLGACRFEIFTTGKGSEGGTLGWFCIGNKNIRYSKSTRRMFLYNPWWGDKEYIDKNNFVAICEPTIKLNGNYSWTEKAAASTLLHEMCHYYTYKDGYVRKQSHGVEFKSIAARVSAKSNGLFTVQRIASAEQMDEMTLNPEMQAKRDKRIESKKSRVIPTFLYMINGEVRFLNATNNNLINDIVDYESKHEKLLKAVTCTDPEFINFLFNKGYKSTMRTYKYWDFTNKSMILQTLDNYQTNVIFNKEPESKPEVKPEVKQVNTANNDIVKHFRFQTIQGNVFDVRNVTKEELKNKLKERFPKWSEETINRVMNTEKYHLNENNDRIMKIILDELRKFQKREEKNSDIAELPADINLGTTNLE